MRNVRHLWTSVRPNGEARPHDLNRLEVRICDLITDPLLLLAVCAFSELRLQMLLADPARHDPLRASDLAAAHLARLADANDQAAALASLDARLHDWRDGEPIEARDWIRRELRAMAPLADDLALSDTLAPLERLLQEGNQALCWLELHRSGRTIGSILAAEAAAMEAQETALAAWLATDAPHALG
jgi:predicted glutamate--cysteine ligase